MKNQYFKIRVGDDFINESYLPNYIQKQLPKNLKSKILDYGCGLGGMLCRLGEMGYENIYGYDIDSYAIKVCTGKRIKIIDIDEMSNDYDLIIMSHVLEHIDKNQMISLLENLRSRLSVSGKIIIAVPNAQSNTGSYWRYEDFTHKYIFTSGSLKYVLQQAGYKNIEFLDIDGLDESVLVKRVIKYLFLSIYKLNKKFWNKITSSYYHQSSLNIYTYEIKVIAN